MITKEQAMPLLNHEGFELTWFERRENITERYSKFVCGVEIVIDFVNGKNEHLNTEDFENIIEVTNNIEKSRGIAPSNGPLIKDIPMSQRLRNVITMMDYYEINKDIMPDTHWDDWRIGHFARLTMKDVLKVRNCGRKTVMELEDIMERYGYRLKQKI